MKKTREESIAEAKKEEVVEIYEELLKKIWDRIVFTLGAVTMAALLRRVIKKTVVSFSFIEELTVSNDGLNFSRLKEKIGIRDKKMIRNGFEELILNFFDLLAELTGDTIVDKLFKKEMLEEVKK